jgi:hypothetical protein
VKTQLSNEPPDIKSGGSAVIRTSGFEPFTELECGPVSDFPRFEFKMRDVRRAGEILAGDLAWNEETEAGIREAFSIANNWRDAHAYPMRGIRRGLAWHMRANGIEGTTVARLKRMQAIRKKLRRLPHGLNQIQDLGGCRAILPSVSDVSALVQILRDRARHIIRGEDDYIASPKISGYRSHHIMFGYKGRGDEKIYDGRRIEVQIRTRLQHSWATAVEAVGLFRSEYLKGGQGDERWLRLFLLMSAEFAMSERCASPQDVPAHHLRVSEIKALAEELEASKNLDKLAYTVRFTDISVNPRTKPTYYLIKYDNATNQVDVEPYFAPKDAMRGYDSAEFLDNRTGKNSRNVVLVEADKLDTLKAAYPNYFGDVQLFRMQLRNIIKGEGVKDYKIKPQETVQPRPGENPDLTWLRRRVRWTDSHVRERRERSRVRSFRDF